MKVPSIRRTAATGAAHREFAAAIACIVAAASIASAFVWQDAPASFANDSVSYLIIARYLSPWFRAGELVINAFPHEHYPPLFPALLALTGTSQSFLAAHLVVAACFAASLVAVYLLARRWFAFPLPLLLVALFAASPVVWRNLLGILSENLYLFLSLLALHIHRTRFEDRAPDLSNSVQLGVVFAAALLTRTIGLSLISAYVIWSLLARPPAGSGRLRYLIPVLIPVFAALAWYGLRPGSDGSHSVAYLAPEMRGLSNAGALVRMITPQAHALYQAWYTAVLGYWTSAAAPNYLIATLAGLLAMGGLVRRVYGNHLDGWYVLAYLSILLIWPFPGQFGRFIYVIYPLLLFLAVDACLGLVCVSQGARSARRAAALLLVVMLAIVLPSAAFFANRAANWQTIGGVHLNRVAEFYYYPNLTHSERLAVLHGSLLQDMTIIRRTTPASAVIMWYNPDYICLLAHRQAVPVPSSTQWQPWLRMVRASGADYVFLSRLKPRDTIDNGLTAASDFRPFTEPVWVHRSPLSKEVLSALLRIDHNKLDQLAGARRAGESGIETRFSTGRLQTGTPSISGRPAGPDRATPASGSTL